MPRHSVLCYNQKDMEITNAGKKVLITGGAGYIGSHCALALLQQGYKVVILDNLSTGHIETIEILKKQGDLEFYKADLCNEKELKTAFSKCGDADVVMHFAAYSQVGESVKNPQKYYNNNIKGSMNLLNEMLSYDIKKIVFSSTAAIYGNPAEIPITEAHPQKPINTYGKTKLFIENILDDYDTAYGLKSVRLRYFNAAGANPEGLIGEWHEPETHLIPNILRASKDKEFCLYGIDYDTKDGTCIRDYVNIEDLASAHIKAIEYLMNGGKSQFINIGTGEGRSIKEVFHCCEQISGKDISFKICPKREGDPPVLIADNKKAKEILNWAPQRSFEDSVQSAYNWSLILKKLKTPTNKRLKIGIFNDSFYPLTDGVISVVDNYARRLSKYADVIVFVPKYFRKKYDDSKFPYKVVRCQSVKVPRLDYSLPLPKLDRKFSTNLKKYNLDIIHIHSPFSVGRAGLKYAVRHNIPCVATMHTQFKQDLKKFFKFERIAERYNQHLIKFFNKCDECWAVNKEVARIYHEEYKYKCVPRVMNNATEMVLTDKHEAFEIVNKMYNIKKDEKVFIFVGRINTLKNILFIADSIAKVKELCPDLKFKMLYVGSGRDEDKLKDKIKELNLDENVIMCGKVSDRKLLAQLYSRADLMLFPSVYDCSSIVQIEAASQKTPVLFLKNTATACMIEDNVNGFLSDYNVNDYASRIVEIINNKNLYDTVCENAYKMLYKTWDETVDEAYLIYENLIKLKNETLHNDAVKKEFVYTKN